MEEKELSAVESQSKLKSYIAFTKPRLSLLVVVSSISGYLLAVKGQGVDAITLSYLIVGGYLLTAASNGINQIWEIESDKLMDRTKNRPLPTGALSKLEALNFSIIMFLISVYCLWQLNASTMIFGIISFILYSFIYTPMKKKTPWSVFVGAIPGAMPPMLGYVAFTGEFGLIPGILFFVQFMWQFPHFWAIAWVLHDDYLKGGFHLLPSKGGRDANSAFIILVYTAILIPVSILPWAFPAGAPLIGNYTMSIIAILGVVFFIPAYQLYEHREMKYAKRLMFTSFLYLPIIQFLYLSSY